MRPDRAAWGDFPDVLIHANESAVKKHPDYHAAKTGDADAAARLVSAFVRNNQVEAVARLLGGRKPILTSVHAEEFGGINKIPEALADILSLRLGLDTDTDIIQANIVNHTGADGFSRLARQAVFEGEVRRGAEYLIVDDFVGQGGTITNLRGFIEANGGHVIGATVLTGKPHSAKLRLTPGRLSELRDKHGNLENWWHESFGFGFDALTESEARYLVKTPDADKIRDRVSAARQAADGQAD